MVMAPPELPSTPDTDADWCLEALASHTRMPFAGIIATDAVAAPHAANSAVSSITRLTNATWWASRSPSVRLTRTLTDYQTALALVVSHANSLMFIDPFIDPSNVHQYSDLMTILVGLRSRSTKPVVEIHRAACYGPGNDKRPRVTEVTAALKPTLATAARAAGISVEVFLWDEVHDRYLISDLIGISVPYGFGTTRAPGAFTTWTRLGRTDRDSVQRDFDPAYRTPRHTFKVS